MFKTIKEYKLLVLFVVIGTVFGATELVAGYEHQEHVANAKEHCIAGVKYLSTYSGISPEYNKYGQAIHCLR